MLLAYNTNGFAHHNLLDAIGVLADIGYRGVSITLDHGALNPFDDRFESQLELVASLLEKHSLRCAIETGGRFLLNATTKHEPTLVTADPEGRMLRVDFYHTAIDIAARLGATCVSLWSGVLHDGAGQPAAHDRLCDGLTSVLSYAAERGVTVAFEPEPGMAIDTLAAYDRLRDEFTRRGADLSPLRLTIDVGHLHCLGELPLPAKIREYAGQLANVHIEDMRPGIHEHLMFGEGTIDFPPVIAALTEIGYDGLLSVELSRHSHNAVAAAKQSYDFLAPLLNLS